MESPLTPGISVIAGAYNEEVTIIDNVRSLLNLNYPRYEVIIVNDGSKDATLEKLITAFNLRQVEFAYHYFVKNQPVKGFYKSNDHAYSKLLVIDKENGGSKADAINAGINAAMYKYFLNTDVDCILSKDVLLKLIQPFLDDKKRVIATGATLRMANSCIVENGEMVKVRAPRKFLPLFQEIEYTRAYVLGKMGWNAINAIPNVSGGLGLFDREIVINVGGYHSASFAEDMDIVTRMCKYMCDIKEKYAIRYVPQTLCWTQGPATLKVFRRQRVRWGRGLYQIFSMYYKLLFNPKYRILGLIVFANSFIFELLAPIIEFLGIICYILLISTGLINWGNAVVLLIFVYSCSVLFTILAILWDQLVCRQYSSWKEVFMLCFAAFFEPFVYHPMVLIFALWGYTNQFFRSKHKWGSMERQGFDKNTTETLTAI